MHAQAFRGDGPESIRARARPGGLCRCGATAHKDGRCRARL